MATGFNDVTLAQVNIEGYRSCRNTTFSPNAQLSALIGINGAGKTNLLSAIRLLGSQGRRLGSITSERESALNETVITAWFLVNKNRIGYRLRLLLSVSNKNTDEITTISEEWNFGSLIKSKAWRSIPPTYLLSQRNQSYHFKNERELATYERQLYMSLNSKRPSTANAGYFEESVIDNTQVRLSTRAVSSFCRQISYYGASQFTDPSRCPSSFEMESDGRLSEVYGTSRVHAKFLYDLYTLRRSNPDLYQLYEAFISKSQLGLISRLTWKEVQLSSNIAEVKSGGKFKKVRKYKTLIIPKIQIGLSHITFNQLSEGTFKTLAMVFYIMTDASSCLLIEEPEVCVHHGLLTKIINTIQSYSTTKQVIFSTHSDLVLDQLEPSNVFVVAMTRLGTEVKPMETWVGAKGKSALTRYLAESGTLGEYWRSGGLS